MLRFWDVPWAREKQHVNYRNTNNFQYYVLYTPIQGAILSIELKREKNKTCFWDGKFVRISLLKHTNIIHNEEMQQREYIGIQLCLCLRKDKKKN